MDAFSLPHNTPGNTDFKILGTVDNVGRALADPVAPHNDFRPVDLLGLDAYLMAEPIH
jgi:hypothetical protein